jgi:ferrous iron transport protein A
MTTLDQLRPGQQAVIASIDGSPALVQRLMEMGMIDGEPVELLAVAPLGDPIEIRCGSSRISLRRREASNVTVHLSPPS